MKRSPLPPAGYVSPVFMKTNASNLNSRLLRGALLGNAAFSLTSGTAFVAFPAAIAAAVGPEIAPVIVAAVGMVLLPFGGFVAWLGSRTKPTPWVALGVSLADLGWVGGSAVLLAFAHVQLTSSGVALVIAVSLAVGGFAVGQLRGIARVYADPADAARFRVCVDVRSDGDAAILWENIANFGEIARFAPMLASSRMRDDAQPGVGAVRDCADHGARRWSERCTVLDRARREFEVEFLTREPEFPFPLSALKGGWIVQEAPEGAVVRIWWSGVSKWAVLAPVVPVLFAWQAQRQFPGMVRRLAGAPGTPGAMPRIFGVAPC